MSLTMSAIYATATKAIRDEAMRSFAAGELSQLIRMGRSVVRNPHGVERRVASVLRSFRLLRGAGGLKSFSQQIGYDIPQITKQIQRYAKSGGIESVVVDQVLSGMGPLGSVLRALAERSKLQKPDMELMAQVLREHGYTVFAPEEYPSEPVPGVTARKPGSLSKREKADRRREASERDLTPNAPSTARQTVPVKSPGGKTRYFPIDHPIITGVMVKASSSTNVHSFGYNLRTGELYVRFLAHDTKNSRRGGSLYKYSGVTPDEFIKLYSVRWFGDRSGGQSSPGTWVWHNLRIRGTVSGHQKEYQLVGVVPRFDIPGAEQGYVPRKAAATALGEKYLPRNWKTNTGQWLRSPLPEAFAGRPINRGTPARDSRG